MQILQPIHQPKEEEYPKNPLASDGSYTSSPPDEKHGDDDDADSLTTMTLPVPGSYYLRTGAEGKADENRLDIVGLAGANDDHTNFDQRSLTSTSMKYDRQGKGFLDPTERALRNLDTENKGTLGLDSMYMIMRSLQEEQKKSSELIIAIRDEQKKSMNLRKGLYALCLFATLLALANIGTSFAAAKLAKDTNIASQTNDMVSQSTGERVGTTSKMIAVEMSPPGMDFGDFTSLRRSRFLEEQHEEHLHRAMEDICTSENKAAAATNNGDDENQPQQATVTCDFVGQISYSDALQIYWSFCPDWPRKPRCVGGGVTSLELTCKGASTTIKGGSFLPSKPPTNWESVTEYTVFPTQYEGYAAEQYFSRGLGLGRCKQELDISMYCPKDGSACLVFASADDTCGESINLCGSDDSANEQ